MRIRESSPVSTYGIAILSVLTALAIRILGWSVFADESPFIFFVAALAVASWHGGFGPGLLATVLSDFAVAYYFLPPYREFRIVEAAHIIELCVFTFSGVVISWLMGKLHDTIAERGRIEQELRQSRAGLEIRVRERTAELARSNAQLEEERQRLFSLFNTLPFFVCLLDRDHTIRFANRRFWELFPEEDGRPPHRIIQDGVEHDPSCPSCRARETRSRVAWEWTSAAGRHYQIYDSPFSQNGSSALVMEIGIEITEQRAAEQALTLERNKLLSILRSMREAVYIVNRNYEIEFVNPAFEAEFGAASTGRKCYEHIHGRTEVCPWCRNSDVFDGKSVQWEWTDPKTSKVYDVFDAPVFNQDASVSKLKIIHDVTRHKQTEEALRNSEKELQRLSSELLTAQEAERMRISRELHDELGQTLTLVKLRLGLIEMSLAENQRQAKDHCESASSHIDQAIDNMRRLSRDLCPSALEELGITAALRRLVSESTKASDIRISLDIDDIDALFSPQSCILLYRVFQETLNNIMKHSDAREVKLFAKKRGGRVLFQLMDDGKGLDPRNPKTGRGTGGLGLAFMRERVRTLGGSLKIWSRSGMGTRLRFSVPLSEEGGRR